MTVLIAGCGDLGTEVGLTLLSIAVGLPASVGYAVACAVACSAGILLVRRRLRTLLPDTFLMQPFGVVEPDAVEGRRRRWLTYRASSAIKPSK